MSRSSLASAFQPSYTDDYRDVKGQKLWSRGGGAEDPAEGTSRWARKTRRGGRGAWGLEGVREWKSIREVNSQFQAEVAGFRKPRDVVCPSSSDPCVKRARAGGRAGARSGGSAGDRKLEEARERHGGGCGRTREQEREKAAGGRRREVPFRTNGVKRLSHQPNASLLILGRFDSSGARIRIIRNISGHSLRSPGTSRGLIEEACVRARINRKKKKKRKRGRRAYEIASKTLSTVVTKPPLRSLRADLEIPRLIGTDLWTFREVAKIILGNFPEI